MPITNQNQQVASSATQHKEIPREASTIEHCNCDQPTTRELSISESTSISSSPKAASNTSDSAISISFSSSDTNSSSSSSPSIQDEVADGVSHNNEQTTGSSSNHSLCHPPGQQANSIDVDVAAVAREISQRESKENDVISSTTTSHHYDDQPRQTTRWTSNNDGSQQSHLNHNKASNGQSYSSSSSSSIRQNYQELANQHSCYPQGDPQYTSIPGRRHMDLQQPTPNQAHHTHIYYHPAPPLTQPFSTWYSAIDPHGASGHQQSAIDPIQAAYQSSLLSSTSSYPPTNSHHSPQLAIYTPAHYPLTQPYIYTGHHHHNQASSLQQHHPYSAYYWPEAAGSHVHHQPLPVYYYTNYSDINSNNGTQNHHHHHHQRNQLQQPQYQQQYDEQTVDQTSYQQPGQAAEPATTTRNPTPLSQQLSDETDEALMRGGSQSNASSQIKSAGDCCCNRNDSTNDDGSHDRKATIPLHHSEEDNNDNSSATGNSAKTVVVDSRPPEVGAIHEDFCEASHSDDDGDDNIVRDEGNHHHRQNNTSTTTTEVGQHEEHEDSSSSLSSTNEVAYQDLEPAPKPQQQQQRTHSSSSSNQVKVSSATTSQMPNSHPVLSNDSSPPAQQCYRSSISNFQQHPSNDTNSNLLNSYMLPAPLLGQNLPQSYTTANHNFLLKPHYTQPPQQHLSSPIIPLLLIPSTRPQYPTHYGVPPPYAHGGRPYHQPRPVDPSHHHMDLATQHYYLQSPSLNAHHMYHQQSAALEHLNGTENCGLYAHPSSQQLQQHLAQSHHLINPYKYQSPHYSTPGYSRSQQQPASYYYTPPPSAAAAPATTVDYMTTMNRAMTIDSTYRSPQSAAYFDNNNRSYQQQQQPYQMKTFSRAILPVSPMIAFSQLRLDYNLISMLPIDACPTRTRQAYGMDKVWRDEFEQLFSQLASSIVWTLIEVESNPSIRDSSDIIGYKGRYIVRLDSEGSKDKATKDGNLSEKEVEGAEVEVKAKAEDDKESCCTNIEDNEDKNSNKSSDLNADSDEQPPKTDALSTNGTELESDCDSGTQLDLTSGGSSTGAISEPGELKVVESQESNLEEQLAEEKSSSPETNKTPSALLVRKFPTRFKMFIDSAKVRFCCDHCGHGWTSMKGRVVFWYELFELVDQSTSGGSTSGSSSNGVGDWIGNGGLCANENNLIGYCAYKLFGQQCDVCKIENRFERPMWYPEEVSKVLNNLYNKIGQIYFGFKMPTIDKQRRAGKPKTSHNSSLCQACHDGVCTDRK